jgi:5-oxoprolinase (ATP-hydrolysing)
MAEAIRHISVRKGIDPAGYSLVAFGGAGGQHACRVAELLGMEEVILQMVHLLAISRELPLPFRASVRVGAVSPYKEAA